MRRISPETSPESKAHSRKRPTITDVARAAGVSIAVVSYALNGRPGVSPATRDRVLRIADEYGWRPSAAARSLRTSERSIALALVHSDTSSAYSPHFMDFLQGTQHALADHGYTLALRIVADEHQAAEVYRTGWLERRFDAIIIHDLMSDDPRLTVASREHIPGIALGHPDVTAPLTSLWVNEPLAISSACDLLCEFGHSTIALLHADPERDVVRRNSQAARVSAARHGARLLTHTARHPEETASAARSTLTAPNPPSAIITDSDTSALVVLDVARRLGINVPWDLSIICLGSSPQATLASPSLTSIDVPYSSIGKQVADSIVDLLDGNPPLNVTVELPPVSVRGTLAPPKKVSPLNL